MDLLNYLLQVTNVFAALFGAAVVILVQRAIPVPTTERPRKWVRVVNRILPFLGVFAAVVAVFVLEGFTSPALIKGVVSGLLAEQFVRIWYKSVVGV